jgi:hypothetical protein
LIAKTLEDIPTLDRVQAEAEVDKFFMDCEMVNLYIQYGKEVEKDPNFAVPDTEADEGFFSFRNIVIGYLGYVAATSVPQVFRGYVAEQQVAGQWKPTNVPLVDDWIERTSPEAMARVLQKAAAVVAGESVSPQAAADATTIQAVTDAAADTLQTVADTLQVGLQ